MGLETKSVPVKGSIDMKLARERVIEYVKKMGPTEDAFRVSIAVPMAVVWEIVIVTLEEEKIGA